MFSQRSTESLRHNRDPSAATLVGTSNRDDTPAKSYRHRPPFRYQRSTYEATGYLEVIPLTSTSEALPNVAEVERLGTLDDAGGSGRRRPKPLYWLFTAPKAFRWLFFNGLVSFLWGIALAVFCAGKVPWHWNISQFFKRYDQEWTNEIAALVGSICKLHVTYVLQQALELYSHIIIAREFTLKDLKWMQGVNEETIFAEFPDRKGAPPREEEPQGCWGGVKEWWWAVFRFCSTLRLSWIVMWLGLLLHNTAIVSILQPEEFWQNYPFNDPVPCGIDPGAVTLDTERYLTEDQQQVLDKMSFEIGVQLGNYVDQMSGNTTTAVAGRNYRKDSFAYGGIGGLVEGLQNVPGVQYTAQCTTNLSKVNTVWDLALPGLAPPIISPNFDQFTNFTTLPDTFRPVESHTPMSFNISLFESAMYAVVDPLGNGAFIALSHGARSELAYPLVCSWKALPKLLHVEMVNFTALVIGHDPAEVYPSLTGRSTLATVTGMARASRLGANIQPEALRYLRSVLTLEAGPSYNYLTNATTAQIVETILADGGKASMGKYNWLVRMRRKQLDRSLAFCNSKNRTVASHWRFGNNKKIGWIAVIWTIGMGVLGMWTAVWMSKKRRLDGVSPLGAAGGFALAVGETIPDDQPLVVRHGKVGYVGDQEDEDKL